MFGKLHNRCRITALSVATSLVLLYGIPTALAYNWPWDQGHDSSNPTDPRHPDAPTCDPCCDCTRSPVFTKSGNYFLSFRDFTLTGSGPYVVIGRTYNSQDLRSGPLGRGWTFDYGAQLISVIDDDGDRTVIIRLSNGQRIRFTENADGTFAPPFGVTATLVKNGDGTYTFTETDGTRHEFDADGKLITIVDRNNNQLSFSYDGTGCLNGATDAAGRSFDITKDVNGKISSITGPAGRAYAYEYDVNGNLIRITDPSGTTTTFGYDSRDRLVSLTDGRGNVVRTVAYDDQDRVVTYTEGGETYTMTYLEGQTNKTDSQGNTWQYFYDEMGMVDREIDPLGNEVTRQHNSVDPRQYDWRVDANGNRYEYTYDDRGNQTSVTDPLGNAATFTYEPNFSQVETETDARGVLTKYEYDANGNPTKEIRAFGAPDAVATNYTYDQSGNPASMTDGNGDTWTYTYDASGNMTSVADPLGNTTAFTYDAIGNTLSVTNANNNTASYQYDAMNRVIAETDALGNTIHRAYDENGNLISETDRNGNTTFFDYDIYNRLIKTTDPLGDATTRTYDAKGNLTSVTDANGKVTYHKYDALSRRIKTIQKVNDAADVEDGDDAVTQFGYDNVGNLISLTDPNGDTTTFAYDALNRLTSQTNPLGETTTYTYDAVGNKLTETLPNGNVVSYAYDSSNRVVSISDSAGLLVSYTYDALGNRLTEADANGNAKTHEYDALNRLTKTTDSMGGETTYSYDGVGNLLTVTDREGNTISHNYDAINRKIATTDGLGNTTSYQYDNVGSLTRITDANGNPTTYEYDAANRLVRETYADNTSREFTHDGVGNVLTRLDQNGNVTRYEYDDLYRLTKRDYPDNNDDIFTYDKVGQMLDATNLHGHATFTYDSAKRMTQTTQNGHTIGYTYDIPNNRRIIAYPGGKVVTENRDGRGRLTNVEETGTGTVASYVYDAAGRLSSKNYLNGTATAYSYNTNNWMTSVTHAKNAVLLAGFQRDFDKEGNPEYNENLLTFDLAKEHTHSEQYNYDSVYRLNNFKTGQLAAGNIAAPVKTRSWSLDPLGNWNSNTDNGVTENRTHNVVNEVSTIDAAAIAHDDNGNLIEDDRYTYEYDFENRLTRVTRKSDAVVLGEYRYDALGRRIEKDASGATTVYLYDDTRVIQERSVGGIEAEYIYGDTIDEALSMERGGQTYYYHSDALGTIVALTDASGAPVERYVYDAYGEVSIMDGAGTPLPNSAVGNPYLFTGRRLDERTGLYYYRARHYSPELGRFLQRDPLGFDGGSANLYEYVASRPTIAVDPTGKILSLICMKICTKFPSALVAPCLAACAYMVYKGGCKIYKKVFTPCRCWTQVCTFTSTTVTTAPGGRSARVGCMYRCYGGIYKTLSDRNYGFVGRPGVRVLKHWCPKNVTEVLRYCPDDKKVSRGCREFDASESEWQKK